MKNFINFLLLAVSLVVLSAVSAHILGVDFVNTFAALSALTCIALFFYEVIPANVLGLRSIVNKPGDNTARNYTFYEAPGTIAYAATINLPVLAAVSEQHYYFATLTGAMTINLPTLSKANLVKGDKVVFILPIDGTSRTVTWGTNIKAGVASTTVGVISGKIFMEGFYDGTDLIIRN